MEFEEQRELADECFLEFKGYEELAAYTAAVEAKERERVAKHLEEQISYSDAHTSEDLIIESTLTTVVAQIRSL